MKRKNNLKSIAHRVVLLSLLLCLIGCSFFTHKIIDTPIALHRAGSVVEADFKIPQDDRISLYLSFSVNNKSGDRDRLLNFLGFPSRIMVSDPQGVTVPLKVKIIKYVGAEELVILDKTYATTGSWRIGQTQLTRLIDELSIKSGAYRIRLETIKNFTELSSTPVRFLLSYIRAPT